MKFKVGDRVITPTGYGNGVIVQIQKNDFLNCKVEHDRVHADLHCGGDVLKEDRFWWYQEEALTLE